MKTTGWSVCLVWHDQIRLIMAISTQTGMGSRFFGTGAGFRVWAPFARSVAVAGNFNAWSTTAHPLTSENNGFWSIDIEGVKVGDEYKYVLNDFNGNVRWRNDPYAREFAPGLANTLVHESDIAWPNFDWSDDHFQMPSWNELVIYELHIGTFAPAPLADTAKFAAAETKLDYLRDLGVNAIEIMAAAEFITETSWGYNPSYLFAIESSFGGIKGFKAFVKAAHQRGIAVIFDVVYNHIGDAQDLWQFDGWSQNGLGGIYFYNDWRHKTGFGERFDYGRGEVRQYLCDNALLWLEKRHVDGLRFDATAFIRNAKGNDNPGDDLPDGWSLMQWINALIKDKQGWKITIAEDLRGNDWITKEVGAGGAGFGAQWENQFTYPVRHAVAVADDASRDMEGVRAAIVHRYNDDAFKRVIYTESHDEVAHQIYGEFYRVPEEIWRGKPDSWASKKRSTLAAGLVLTSPGIPMLFQGQEFLEGGQWNDRDLLDWNKATQFEGIMRLYRDLIHLRRNWFNTTRGLRGQNVNVHHVNNTDKMIAFHRFGEGGAGDDVVIVANFANRSYDNYIVGFPRPGLWKVRFNSDSSAYSSDFNNHFSYDTQAQWGNRDGMPCQANVGIGQYSLVIFSQD